MKIHVAIISDQTLANLIPLLMDPPAKVYLVCSDAMKSRGLDSRIRKLLEHEGIGVETRWGAPNAGLKSIQDYARSLAAEIQRSHPGAHIVFNATGGTKLMSLGFLELFRHFAQEIIYTDTSHRCIERFPDTSGATIPPVEMRHVLDVPRYLAAQGFRYLRARSDDPAWRKRVASHQAVCKYLGEGAELLQEFIGVINRLAKKALEKQSGTNEEVLRCPRQSLHTQPRGAWSTALAQMDEAGVIDWLDGGREIRFCDAESARFLRGGWLEEYAWHLAKEEGAWDVRCSVEVIDGEAARARNELDVLACHSNELLVIECKTLRHEEENENLIAYKIDSLGQQVRGLFGETWLLSARKPTDNLPERARRARIRLIGPADLPTLRSAIREWIKRPTKRSLCRATLD